MLKPPAVPSIASTGLAVFPGRRSCLGERAMPQERRGGTMLAAEPLPLPLQRPPVPKPTALRGARFKVLHTSTQRTAYSALFVLGRAWPGWRRPRAKSVSHALSISPRAAGERRWHAPRSQRARPSRQPLLYQPSVRRRQARS